MAYPTGELSVDLRAIADNWRYIAGKLHTDTHCGAVVKANAYGLGVDRIAPKIYEAGCRNFFVANLKEAIQLQSLLGPDALIFVLSGCIAGAEETFVERNIIPVIVSYSMLTRWVTALRKLGDNSANAQAVLKVDTGMGRLGLEATDFNRLLEDDVLFREAKITYLMSHLACADDTDHNLNALQIARFNDMYTALKAKGFDVKTSLANSAGIFLGEHTHGDIVRPGIALYGGNPGLKINPMQPVVGLSLPILQIRHLVAGEAIGYGATRRFDENRVIAIASGGYADGIMRSLGNKGWGFLAGHKVPIVGRISMDSTMFDITDVPSASDIHEGAAIEILGENVSIDDLARAAGTISYEILTSFGARYQRCYLD
ncbi:alanine racemase [Agarilytica rhodophyticola]|uniref:alanine racemase n=1 Tax=Agarilytica rhodophyticola TaxID=1737490 RepID=UPI000B349890|nr:alanine racemase [Agarilytica rhodophyticola]